MWEDPWSDYLQHGVVRLGPNGERTDIPPPAAPTGYTGQYAAGTSAVQPTQTVQRPAAPPPTASPDAVSYRNAIASIESAGSGGYRALGPYTRRGDRAYGRYQVMGNNVGPWSRAALGYELTPSQFLNNPQAQDAVFDHIFGGYVSKYGNPQDAASAWFTGRPLSSGAGARDLYGTTGSGYVARFNRALGNPTSASAGNQPMPTYDNRGAGMAGYGPVFPLPASPFQQGGGGGQVPAAGGRGRKQLEAYQQAHAQVAAAINQLMMQRAQGAGRGGILGPALMAGLAGAASRVGGPAGGLVAGLASGLASGMKNRGAQDLQNQMAMLQLYKMKEAEAREMLPEYKIGEGNLGKVPYTQTPGELPQVGWGDQGQPQGQPQAPGQPQAQGEDPWGFNKASPENITKAVGDWKNQSGWLTTRGIPSYTAATKLYDMAQAHPSRPNDMAFLQALRTISNPGAIRSAGGSDDQVATAQNMWDRWDTLLGELKEGKRDMLQPQTRDEIMDTINQWFKPQYEQARGAAENNKALWKDYLKGSEDKAFYLPPVEFRDVDLNKYNPPIPQGAIDELRANPALRQDFESKFKVKADKYLGGSGG